jgi:hypothetical protein
LGALHAHISPNQHVTSSLPVQVRLESNIFKNEGQLAST